MLPVGKQGDIKMKFSKETLKKWKKPALIVLIVLLALLLVAALGIAIAGSYVLDKLGSAQPTGTIAVIPPEFEDFEVDEPEDVVTEPDQTDPDETEGVTDPTGTEQPQDPTETTKPTEPPTRPNFAWPEVERLQSNDVLNILLIGQDSNKATGQRSRSDSMILLSLNKKNNTITMTSFMRDLYVSIPGYGDDKMNHAYAYGGMKLLTKCMDTNFGIHIDGNIEVDFRGFQGVIDLMGGVDIYLSNSEANHLVNNGHSAVPGMNHLDGKAALAYARNRSVGNGDFSRTERQRKVLNALFEKCRGMSLSQLQTLMENVLPLITTDMTNRQILDYLVDMVPMLGDMQVNNNRIPADDTYQYASIRGMSVLLPDLAANRALLEDIMTRTTRLPKE